jgi:hypothetical protein
MSSGSQHSFEVDLQELIVAWKSSPAFSIKIDSYFPAYAKLFGHLRGTNCIFIECGVLGGGSLFMWKRWLGDKARIVGVDLNPEALKWKNHGFEIFIGDQGDPNFWSELFRTVGTFDALLDDGGHQSFQQIVTLNSALTAAERDCVIAIEDTATSYFHDFKKHGKYTFLSYAKSSTDLLLKKILNTSPGRISKISNPKELDIFQKVQSVEFFAGIVAYNVVANMPTTSNLIKNMDSTDITDFRYRGKKSTRVLWPTLFKSKAITIRGGATLLRSMKMFLQSKKILK